MPQTWFCRLGTVVTEHAMLWSMKGLPPVFIR